MLYCVLIISSDPHEPVDTEWILLHQFLINEIVAKDEGPCTKNFVLLVYDRAKFKIFVCFQGQFLD